jgi:hypothetical protein
VRGGGRDASVETVGSIVSDGGGGNGLAGGDRSLSGRDPGRAGGGRRDGGDRSGLRAALRPWDLVPGQPDRRGSHPGAAGGTAGGPGPLSSPGAPGRAAHPRAALRVAGSALWAHPAHAARIPSGLGGDRRASPLAGGYLRDPSHLQPGHGPLRGLAFLCFGPRRLRPDHGASSWRAPPDAREDRTDLRHKRRSVSPASPPNACGPVSVWGPSRAAAGKEGPGQANASGVGGDGAACAFIILDLPFPK